MIFLAQLSAFDLCHKRLLIELIPASPGTFS
jgi:hypothetical protein